MTATTDRSDLIASLTEGISRLTTSEDWQRYLDCQSRFYHYSANNVMLIATQRHDATQVAGFNAWRKLDRFVRKGEKAIWILAPMVYTATEADDPEDGQAKVIRGFKWVPVFDVAQTDGKELPSPCQKLTGDDPGGLLPRLIEFAQSVGFTVDDAHLGGTRNGECSHALRRIRLETDNAPAQRVKTLGHELGHALLHEHFEDRALAELEAESVAYVVCHELGIDSGTYSFGYAASWGGGTESVSRIKASCERIQKAAAVILRPFEVGAQEKAA